MTLPQRLLQQSESEAHKVRVPRAAVLAATLAVASLGVGACSGDSNTSTEQSDGASSTQQEHFDRESLEPLSDIHQMLPNDITNDGTLRVAMALDYVPAEYLLDNGLPAGYNVEIALAMGSIMGVQVEIDDVPFPDLSQEIGSSANIGISSLTITPERLEDFEMVSYMEVGSVFAVANGNPGKFNPQSPCGSTVGVLEESSQLKRLQVLNNQCTGEGESAIEVESLAQLSDIVARVIEGKIDAVFADSGVLAYMVEDTNGKMELIGEVVDVQAQGVAVPKDNEQLTVATQAALQHLMDEGYLEEILAPYSAGAMALTQAQISPNPANS